MRETPIPPSEIRRRLSSWQNVAKQIFDGLSGKPFNWCGGELDAYRPKAKAMGITLITKTHLKKLGYRLKKNAKPVGWGYFLAPISSSAALYVLECQAVKDNHNQDIKDGDE